MLKSHLTLSIFAFLCCGAIATTAHAQGGMHLDPSKRVTQYPLDVWGADEGLPQKSIYAIMQSRDGYLWLGTQEGLVRFDGIRFQVLDKTNSALHRNAVSAIAEGPDGEVWVGTREGGLTLLRADQSTTFTRDDGLSSDNVSSLAVAADGTLWIGTDDAGVNVYRNGVFDSYTVEDGVPSKRVNVLHVDRNGILWIGTRGAGLASFDGSEFTHFSRSSGLPGEDVTALYEGEEGTLWIGTRDGGLAKLTEGGLTAVAIPGLDEPESGGPAIRGIIEDSYGSLWIGVGRRGLVRLRGSSVEALNSDNGLPSDMVRSMLEDREGILWVGTDGGGLARLHNGKFTPWGKREGLASDYIYGIMEDGAGSIWAGSEGGGVSRLKNGRITNITSAEGLPSDVVYAVAQTGDGSTWFGTGGGGLVRLKGGKLRVYSTEDGLPTNTIYSLYSDSRDRLWIATSSGGLTVYSGGTFSTITTANGLSSNLVTAIAESSKKGLWVGTYDGGLNYVKDGRVLSRFTTANGLNSDYVLSLYEDEEGVLWVGTREGGIHRIKEGRVRAITTKDGLFNDIVNTILEDDAGYLWMSCNKGLFRVSRSDLNHFADGKLDRVESESYDRSDGLRSDEFNGGFQPAGWRGRDGHLWFSSDVGYIEVDPNRIPINKIPPLVHIETVVIDGVTVRPAGNERHEVKPGAHKFEFRYVGLSFVASEQIRYEYQLLGVDDSWVDAGSRRVAYYTNLSPGDYVFQVRARNADAVWSDGISTFQLYLKPRFYETTWFILFCIIVLISASILVYRVRVRTLKQQQVELERLVEERTRDLREEKERTETALQETEAARKEAEAQKDIAQRAKTVIEAQAERLRDMDRIKSRFFGNISHEFRTPLTLTIGPLENALTGMYGPASPALSRQLEIMLRNSRRLLRLINQLLDLSKLEAGSMRLRVIEGNIVEMIEGVVMSFTAFAEKEGIDLTFDASSTDIKLFFDPANLEKVFFNLLSNAVKFTPEKGRVSVSVTETTELDGGLEVEGIEVRIADTGQGIPEADQPFIFDRFHQVDGTVSRVQEGTGIGLSLVKELVELHGGSIQVESQVGEGTEFIVTLRKGTRHLSSFDLIGDEGASGLLDVTRGPMMEVAVFEEMDGNGNGKQGRAEGEPDQKVLVVDDSVDIRNYVVSCLDSDYTVVTAKDGIDGLEKVELEQPDLVVSDVMMPRMDGYEFCRLLKSDDRFNHIPVVLLTSKASIDAKIEGLQAGSDDYISKPFNAEELRVRIANLIRMREQSRVLKTLNSELESTNESLRAASDLKSQLLNIASHDMKNPLTAIREFSRILREEMGSDSHLNELVDLIFSSSDEMLRLVTQLLDSSALESGKLELNRRPVDLSALAQLVVHRNSKQAELKGQKLHFKSGEEGKGIVMADFDRLQEAMNNLVNNAIKYSDREKSIWVTVVTLVDEVRFEVRDEGPGIDPDEVTRVFDKFQKLSNQPTGGESSSGLGLSIVKQIVELHGGSVWVESELGRGSLFVIGMPRGEKKVTAPDRAALASRKQSSDDAASVASDI